MNKKIIENSSQEIKEHNHILKEKSNAYKKLAEALNEYYLGHLSETREEDENTTKNQRKSKKIDKK
ncbi:MAG: hypothetical protein WCI92_17965 [Bacteroidota bacterium]